MKENVIKISFQNGRATVDLGEHETSFEEWMHLRKVSFSKLRQYSFIPGELIDLVEDLKERTPVQLYMMKVRDDSCPESPVGLRFGVKVVGTKPKQQVVNDLAEIETDEQDDAVPASDALALFLWLSLRDLKVAEKDPGAAPVRLGQFLPRSLIAEIAWGLLERCQDCDCPPGPQLVGLIRELLDLQSYKQGASREFDAREQAISILAQTPAIGTRELAREVEVDPTTVSRWRKDSDFNEQVRRRTEWIKKPNPLMRENHE